MISWSCVNQLLDNDIGYISEIAYNHNIFAKNIYKVYASSLS